MLPLTLIFTVISLLSTASTSDDGRRSSNESFYWSALITPQFENSGEWNCSGAFIGKKHVITSGVCVQGYSKFRIKLGAYYTHHHESNITRLQFKYDRLVDTNIGSKHDSSDNKLSIIRLDEDPTLSFGTYIQPISLPPEPTLNQLNDALSTNNTAQVLVWVQDKDGDLMQRTLEMNLLLFLDCLTVRPEVNIHTELCAAGEKFDGKYLYLCPNIGFGPLLVTGLHTLIGIGIDNCVEDKPQTFLRINGYWKWIKEVVVCGKNYVN